MSSEALPQPLGGAPVLHLDGFDGPMDLLLDLARAQKVDLARISICSLVEQYLAIVAEARAVRLELAADWLVMAAWLTWLKSRLLLPSDDAAAEEGCEAAGMLAARLAALEAMQDAAAWLAARPRLGRDVHRRGLAERFVQTDRSGLRLDMPQLLRAMITVLRRQAATARYVPRPPPRWSVADALSRLSRMLGRSAGWLGLDAMLPEPADGGEAERGAIAATLLAGLELARDGGAELRQDEAFGLILLRARRPAVAENQA